MGTKQSKAQEKDEIEFLDDDLDDDGPDAQAALEVHLTRLISYASNAPPSLQREVAEKLANEAVHPSRQTQIVKLGGLDLLVPLTESADVEVRRLAAHALANLSVDRLNQELIGKNRKWVSMIISLLNTGYGTGADDNNAESKETKNGGYQPNQSEESVHRQASKALANLGVHPSNKILIASLGGLPPLIRLSTSKNTSVSVEAVAAIANLAVNDFNEVEICRLGGVEPVLKGLETNCLELQSQCARALRNLSVNEANKKVVVGLGGVEILVRMKESLNRRDEGKQGGKGSEVEKLRLQVSRALVNLGGEK